MYCGGTIKWNWCWFRSWWKELAIKLLPALFKAPNSADLSISSPSLPSAPPLLFLVCFHTLLKSPHFSPGRIFLSCAIWLFDKMKNKIQTRIQYESIQEKWWSDNRITAASRGFSRSFILYHRNHFGWSLSVFQWLGLVLYFSRFFLNLQWKHWSTLSEKTVHWSTFITGLSSLCSSLFVFSNSSHLQQEAVPSLTVAVIHLPLLAPSLPSIWPHKPPFYMFD